MWSRGRMPLARSSCSLFFFSASVFSCASRCASSISSMDTFLRGWLASMSESWEGEGGREREREREREKVFKKGTGLRGKFTHYLPAQGNVLPSHQVDPSRNISKLLAHMDALHCVLQQ